MILASHFLSDHFLSSLVILPLIMALLIPLVPERENGKWVHVMGIAGSAIIFLFSALGWGLTVNPAPESYPWFPNLGISFSLAADGISMTLVVLTTFLLLMAAVASYSNIKQRLKLYYSMLFILTTALLGVFTAHDLFLFFLFFELELIPMYLLIAIWGGPNRDYASIKFVLYTLFGSVFIFSGILVLYFTLFAASGPNPNLFSFTTLSHLIQTPGTIPVGFQVLAFILLFIGFAVKLPVVPLHTWLPDAHVEAPTPVSMLLAGILLKMGGYGMLRLCFGMMPQAAHILAPYIAVLAAINIVYTASVALVQKDLKKLIAYSSVSHMGFVILGLASLNATGYNGAVFVMFSHGIVSAALFMCVGTLYLRTHTRLISDYGGFGIQTPIIFYFFMFMSMASLGLPLLISFAGESLVFYGAYLSNAFQEIALWGNRILPWSMQALTIFSAIGVILGAAYLLWMLYRVFFGPISTKWQTLPDATRSEIFVLGTLTLVVLIYGLYPSLITSRFEPDTTAMARYPQTLMPYPHYILSYRKYPPLLSVRPGARDIKDSAFASQLASRGESGFIVSRLSDSGAKRP